jgi:MFS family permease
MATSERPLAATLASAARTLLVLVAFTTSLATLPATAAGVHAGRGTPAWILSGMSMGCAAGLLGSGVLDDNYGRRHTFLAGALVLAGGSLPGSPACSPSGPRWVAAPTTPPATLAPRWASP